MSEHWHGVCPHCRHRLHVHGRPAEGARLTCPGCHVSFTIPASAPPVRATTRPAGGWGKTLAALAVLGGCLLLGVVTLSLVWWAGSARKETPSTDRVAETARPEVPEQTAAIPPSLEPPRPKTKEAADDSRDAPPPPPPPPPEKKPTPESSDPDERGKESKPASAKPRPEDSEAEFDKEVNAAIDRGVAYLKQAITAWRNVPAQPKPVGGYGGGLQGDYLFGGMALAGWALLESGVAGSDPSVQTIADIIRGASPNLTATYSLSLAVVFLDKLGEPQDVPLIHSLAVRLLAGQTRLGGWSYECPKLPPAEKARLARYGELCRQRKQEGKKADPRWTHPASSILTELHAILARPPQSTVAGDNSNTQFAVMALWVARRHHIPVRRALAYVRARFLASQQREGGWGYFSYYPGNSPPGTTFYFRAHGVSTPFNYHNPNSTFTSVALYALATGHAGTRPAGTQERRLQDRIDKELKFLDSCIDKEIFDSQTIDGALFYSLFSIEKTAVVYGWKQLGGKSWYRSGARQTLKKQDRNGRWRAGWYGDTYNQGTSFALLFLKRANPSADLTAILKGELTEPIRKTPPEHLPKDIRDPHQLDSDVATPVLEGMKEKAEEREKEKESDKPPSASRLEPKASPAKKNDRGDR